MTALYISNFFNITRKKKKLSFFHESLLQVTMIVMDNDDDQETPIDVARLVGVLEYKPQGLVHEQNLRKEWWEILCWQKSDDEFVEKMQIVQTNF